MVNVGQRSYKGTLIDFYRDTISSGKFVAKVGVSFSAVADKWQDALRKATEYIDSMHNEVSMEYVSDKERAEEGRKIFGTMHNAATHVAALMLQLTDAVQWGKDDKAKAIITELKTRLSELTPLQKWDFDRACRAVGL